MTIHPTECLVQGYLGVNFRVLKLKPLCSQLIRSIPITQESSAGKACKVYLKLSKIPAKLDDATKDSLKEKLASR